MKPSKRFLEQARISRKGDLCRQTLAVIDFPDEVS
jgi:hypothetical protein